MKPAKAAFLLFLSLFCVMPATEPSGRHVNDTSHHGVVHNDFKMRQCFSELASYQEHCLPY